MSELEKVTEFAKAKNIPFDYIYFECNWNKFKVYNPGFDNDCFLGLPHSILVDSKGNIRLATDDEEYEIIDSMPDDE